MSLAIRTSLLIGFRQLFVLLPKPPCFIASTLVAFSNCSHFTSLLFQCLIKIVWCDLFNINSVRPFICLIPVQCSVFTTAVISAISYTKHCHCTPRLFLRYAIFQNYFNCHCTSRLFLRPEIYLNYCDYPQLL